MAASAPTWGKSRRSSSRTATAVEPWASQPAPERELVRVTASGADARVMISQTAMTQRRLRALERAIRANHGCGGVGGPVGVVVEAVGGEAVAVTVAPGAADTHRGMW